MTKVMALDWAKFNINVNCVAPGFFATEMTKVQQEDERQLKYLQNHIALRRLGRSEEIVGAVLYLASDLASYVTGTTLFVDGGYTIA